MLQIVRCDDGSPPLFQGLVKLSRNSRTPWFWVVTKLPKLGLGMSQSANLTGIEPETLMPELVRSADRVKVTGRVWPCSVRFPVAE